MALAAFVPMQASDEADGCGFDSRKNKQKGRPKVGDEIDVVCGRRPNKQRGLNWKDFRLRTTLYEKSLVGAAMARSCGDTLLCLCVSCRVVRCVGACVRKT